MPIKGRECNTAAPVVVTPTLPSWMAGQMGSIWLLDGLMLPERESEAQPRP